MVLLRVLLFTLTFYELTVSLDATTCPKGQKVVVNQGKTHCEDCDGGYFQPVENRSQWCKVCTRCDEESGSDEIKHCTKETNTKCQCRGAFVDSDSDSSTCQCNIGFGLKHRECSKCEDGYFSTSINSPCQKWKECKSAGVNTNGTKTSDAICNEESKSNTRVTTNPTSNKVVSRITRRTSHHPHEGAQTQKMLTGGTTSTPGHIITPKTKVQPFYPSNTANHIGILITLAIVGLLVLTTVTCKLYITPHKERQAAIQKHDSLCRRPVEESGDSSLSSLKLNPGEHML